MESRKLFYVFGVIFTLMAAFVITVGILAGSAPAMSAYSMLAMAVMSFCLGYLYPQFKQKDERTKLIKQKGMFVSVMALLAYLILFNIGLHFEFISLTASELIQIFSGLMICTIFISFVIYSKIY